jgi:hypothetical protein
MYSSFAVHLSASIYITGMFMDKFSFLYPTPPNHVPQNRACTPAEKKENPIHSWIYSPILQPDQTQRFFPSPPPSRSTAKIL